MIPPIHVSLPNGDVSVAKFSGAVYLSDALVLQDALFIPDFKFNILAV
jgi:hypothetical protein